RLRDLRRGKERRKELSMSASGDEEQVRETTMKIISPFERELLELALTDEASARKLSTNILADELESPLARGLYQLILEALKRGDWVDFQSIMITVEDAATKNLLVQLDEASRAKADSDLSQRLHDLLTRQERGRENVQRREELAALRE